jgi:hypothetical protein
LWECFQTDRLVMIRQIWSHWNWNITLIWNLQNYLAFLLIARVNSGCRWTVWSTACAAGVLSSGDGTQGVDFRHLFCHCLVPQGTQANTHQLCSWLCCLTTYKLSFPLLKSETLGKTDFRKFLVSFPCEITLLHLKNFQCPHL